MRSLDLFCGTKSFSKIAEKMGYEITTLDILEKFNPDICCDIMEWDYKKYDTGYFDIIWASPNCKDYSCLNRFRDTKRDLTKSNNLVKKVLEIIEYFKPKCWFIENPQSGSLKDQEFMNDIPYNDVDYCKYGFVYRKRTRIYNNSKWNGRLLCKKNNYCINKKNNGKHLNFRWVNRDNKKSTRWKKRIAIPSKLIKEILEEC